MKVLIVDDEHHVRNSIRHLVHWGALGIKTILESENGQQAIEVIIRQQPDIILTDMMMPVMGGKQLMEWLNLQPLARRKIIVISGYNDFELLQHAIRFGGMDYLLKPIDGDQLNETMAKAVNELRTAMPEPMEREKMLMDLQELEFMYRDKALSDLLERHGTKQLELLSPFIRKIDSFSTCRIAVLRFNTLEVHAESAAGDRLHEYAKTIEQQLPAGFAFVHWHRRTEIVCLCPEAEQRLLHQALAGLTAQPESTPYTGLHIGLSASVSFPNALHAGYLQAVEALDNRNVHDLLLTVHSFSAHPFLGRLRFDQVEEAFLLAIHSGSMEQIEQSATLWIDVLRAMPILTYDQLRKWIVEYRIVRQRWLDSFYETEENPSYLQDKVPPSGSYLPLHNGEISLDQLQLDFTADLKQLQHVYADRRREQQPNAILEIADFLRNHYREDISLTEISNRFFLNKEYISRRFKQEFGETITDYTNRIRIEKAKVLLFNEELKVADVAQMVGYKDEKYFSRVFKKIEFTSPNRYRVILRESSTKDK